METSIYLSFITWDRRHFLFIEFHTHPDVRSIPHSQTHTNIARDEYRHIHPNQTMIRLLFMNLRRFENALGESFLAKFLVSLCLMKKKKKKKKTIFQTSGVGNYV